MKILESQNALLSNYEVYQHLVDQKKRNKAQKRKPPVNYITITNDVVHYLTMKPGPLARQEETHDYKEDSILRLLEKIREAKFKSQLVKAEVLAILNLRPTSLPILATAIEQMDDRFEEHEQEKLVEIIIEVLGRDPPSEEGQALEGDELPSIETEN